MNLIENERAGIHRSGIRIFVTHFNEMPAEHPEVISMAIQGLAAVATVEQMQQKRSKYRDECLAKRNILVFETPGRGPVRQVGNEAFEIAHCG
ncbi:hypothetical protein R69746_08782 [Paraburkholderia aspalathi]|nr:hypothetical protein R69746_08782 [Paraburkholderia aspalathi]